MKFKKLRMAGLTATSILMGCGSLSVVCAEKTALRELREMAPAMEPVIMPVAAVSAGPGERPDPESSLRVNGAGITLQVFKKDNTVVDAGGCEPLGCYILEDRLMDALGEQTPGLDVKYSLYSVLFAFSRSFFQDANSRLIHGKGGLLYDTLCAGLAAQMRMLSNPHFKLHHATCVKTDVVLASGGPNGTEYGYNLETEYTLTMPLLKTADDESGNVMRKDAYSFTVRRSDGLGFDVGYVRGGYWLWEDAFERAVGKDQGVSVSFPRERVISDVELQFSPALFPNNADREIITTNSGPLTIEACPKLRDNLLAMSNKYFKVNSSHCIRTDRSDEWNLISEITLAR